MAAETPIASQPDAVERRPQPIPSVPFTRQMWLTALAKQGRIVRTGTSAQFASLIKSDLARWKKVVVDAKIAVD
ncbi:MULTISPECIES: hypothetical protein [Variovorax]|uniref:hypothetical protein n=1 Tax=Variovorax TaxID=34072 RepID=UPI00286ACAFE|nr:hypothetical protein [Variovorax sp. 3319]